MLQYMGAIANGGKAAVPRLIEKFHHSYGLPDRHFTIRISRLS